MKVCIPAYKDKEALQKCMSAVREQQVEADNIDILVHDNSEENIGFTRAVNKMLRETLLDDVDEYAVILNQDCYLKPGALDAMKKFMDEHPKCAIAGIKQVASDGNTITHGGCLQAFPNGVHEVGLVSRGDCSKNKRVPWANGACLIVRRDAILDFGLMDENFFLICSDSDWCYTARSRWWEVWYIADAEAVHDHGVSISKDTSSQYLMAQDAQYFAQKWVNGELFKDLAGEVF